MIDGSYFVTYHHLSSVEVRQDNLYSCLLVGCSCSTYVALYIANFTHVSDDFFYNTSWGITCNKNY